MKLPLLDTEQARAIVTDDFLAGATPLPPETPPARQEGAGAEPDLDGLAEQLAALRRAFPSRQQRPRSDANAAVLIHRHLAALARREAAVNEFWHYAAVVHCADYVRWRWQGPRSDVTRERFLGRWDGNALGRLWWWAEFTMDPTSAAPYHRT